MNSDIHDRKTAQIELERAKNEAEQAREEAERANQLKSAFLANMSHEIRTPLGAMIGFADLIRDEKTTSTERENYLDVITRNGEQLSVIINDVLDLSKVEAGHLSLEYSEVNIADFVKDVIRLFSLKTLEKEIQVSFDMGPTTPAMITTDFIRAKQIVVNLVANAVKFTRRGFIKIRSEGWTDESGETGLLFEIEDSGIGFSNQQYERIFEVFVQADGSMTRKFGGTGLGLALSRKLARALGGDVYVKESVEGRGTTFIAKLANRTSEKVLAPSTVQVSDPAHRPDHAPLALQSLKVLVVDDSPDNRNLIRRHLLIRGAKVEEAENGEEGYVKAITGDFDVVLMDIQMPILDGYSATQKLRDAGYRPPIIAITAHALNEARMRCLNVGCNDHLPKPLDFKALTETIVRHVQPSA